MGRPSQDVILCSEHCVCLSGTCNQRRFDRFSEKADEITDDLSKDLEKLGLDLTLETYRSKKAENRYRYGLSINPISEERSTGDFYKAFICTERILEASRLLTWKPDNGVSCTTVIFRKEAFKLGGGSSCQRTCPRHLL